MPQYELSLRDYLRIFRKRKLIIAAVTLVAVIFSYFYLSSQKPIYQSSTTVKIEERKTIAGLLTEWIVYSPADVMESQMMIIKGFPVMKKVALALKMINNDTGYIEVHNVVSQLQASISTEIISKTNIIKITATTAVPDRAVEMANTVAQVYIEENLAEKTTQARAARQFIEEQLALLRKRFSDNEESLRKIEDKVKGIKLTGPIQDKLVNLEFELASLLQKYTDKHPLVLQIKEQISSLEGQLKGFSQPDLEYSRLLREVEVNKKLYPMLSEKLEEARITEAQGVNDVTLVDPAVVASATGVPDMNVGLLIGGLLGIILGSISAFIVETMDTSIGTIEDVENMIKLPILGVVPSVLSEMEEKLGFLNRLKRRFLFTNKSEQEENYIRLIVHHKPKSNVAESYRNIRTNLKLSQERKVFLVTSATPREGKTTIMANLGLVIAQTGAKTLLVSSDLRRPGLEKSFGLKREPGITEVILGRSRLDEGIKTISDIMLGEMKMENVIKTPGIENLSILTSGHSSFNPSEILDPRKVANLVVELKKRFDVVLFDSPPVLPITDASLLAPIVDSVILVYEIGRTSRDALIRAKIQIESAGAKIIGIILNHISPEVESAVPYPYYYYRHKYRYYYDKDDAKKRVKIDNGLEHKSLKKK